MKRPIFSIFCLALTPIFVDAQMSGSTQIPETENASYGDEFAISFARDANRVITQIVVQYPMSEDRMVNQNKVK